MALSTGGSALLIEYSDEFESLGFNALALQAAAEAVAGSEECYDWLGLLELLLDIVPPPKHITGLTVADPDLHEQHALMVVETFDAGALLQAMVRSAIQTPTTSVLTLTSCLTVDVC